MSTKSTTQEGKLRWIPVDGATLREMKENARKSDLYQLGDMKLVWANGGDLWNKAEPEITQETAQKLLKALVAISHRGGKTYLCDDPDFGAGYDMANDGVADFAKEALEDSGAADLQLYDAAPEMRRILDVIAGLPMTCVDLVRAGIYDAFQDVLKKVGRP